MPWSRVSCRTAGDQSQAPVWRQRRRIRMFLWSASQASAPSTMCLFRCAHNYAERKNYRRSFLGGEDGRTTGRRTAKWKKLQIWVLCFVAGRKAKVKDNPVGTHSAQCHLFLARDSAAPLKKCLHILLCFRSLAWRPSSRDWDIIELLKLRRVVRLTSLVGGR